MGKRQDDCKECLLRGKENRKRKIEKKKDTKPPNKTKPKKKQKKNPNHQTKPNVPQKGYRHLIENVKKPPTKM